MNKVFLLVQEKCSEFWSSYKQFLIANIVTIFNLLVSMLFALLPLLILASSNASKSNTSILIELEKLFYAEAMFIYCSSFIAPLIILSFTIAFSEKRKNYRFYPFALLGCLYVLIVGALMYSGVFARNLYSLGQGVPISYPTHADISILIITLIVWYYSTFIDKYTPKPAIDNFADEQRKAFDRYDEATK